MNTKIISLIIIILVGTALFEGYLIIKKDKEIQELELKYEYASHINEYFGKKSVDLIKEECKKNPLSVSTETYPTSFFSNESNTMFCVNGSFFKQENVIVDYKCVGLNIKYIKELNLRPDDLRVWPVKIEIINKNKADYNCNIKVANYTKDFNLKIIWV